MDPMEPSRPDERLLLNKIKLQDLVKQLTEGRHTLDPDLQVMLSSVADDFLESVVEQSCNISKGRQSKVLEIKDVNLCLEKSFGIQVAEYVNKENRTRTKTDSMTQNHLSVFIRRPRRRMVGEKESQSSTGRKNENQNDNVMNLKEDRQMKDEES